MIFVRRHTSSRSLGLGRKAARGRGATGAPAPPGPAKLSIACAHSSSATISPTRRAIARSPGVSAARRPWSSAAPFVRRCRAWPCRPDGCVTPSGRRGDRARLTPVPSLRNACAAWPPGLELPWRQRRAPPASLSSACSVVGPAEPFMIVSPRRTPEGWPGGGFTSGVLDLSPRRGRLQPIWRHVAGSPVEREGGKSGLPSEHSQSALGAAEKSLGDFRSSQRHVVGRRPSASWGARAGRRTGARRPSRLERV